jgi:O-antigen ligase
MWLSSDTISRYIDTTVGFSVPSSHNAFLEIALQLGWIGVGIMALLLLEGLRRAVRCLTRGNSTLGFFSIMFVCGIIMAGLTTETLGQNQVIEWLVFNVLLFSCGFATSQERSQQEFGRQDASQYVHAPISNVFCPHPATLVKTPHP